MIRKTIQVKLRSGMETRPVAMLVQVASKYESDIYVEADNRRMNAKSIMGMMTLGLDEGEEVTVTTSGTDELAAIQGIEAYLSRMEPAAL